MVGFQCQQVIHRLCEQSDGSWLGNRKRILVLNREDMISTADRNAWADYYGRQGIKVVFSNGKLGMGSMKLGRLAKSVAAEVNIKRRARGLLPRPVRAGRVGYPNVGKSSLINRLLKRRKLQDQMGSFWKRSRVVRLTWNNPNENE